MSALRVFLSGLMVCVLAVSGLASLAQSANAALTASSIARLSPHGEPATVRNTVASTSKESPASFHSRPNAFAPISPRIATDSRASLQSWAPGAKVAAAGSAALIGTRELDVEPSTTVDTTTVISSGGWAISLAFTVNTTISLTATVNHTVSSSGMWISIIDMSHSGGPTRIAYCTSGALCSWTGVPSQTQGSYMAVVAPGYGASGLPPSVKASSETVTPAPWTVTLTENITTEVGLIATTNYAATGSTWIEIFDTAFAGTINYLKYCNTGTTCSVATVPKEANASYTAVVGNTIQNTYAQYPASLKHAQSAPVVPPPWTVTLTADISSKIGLTATTNYAATGSMWIEIFDTAFAGNINYLKYCNTGTTCSVATVPKEANASYTAVVGTTIPNKYADYPATRKVAESLPVVPPPWTVSLTGSGTTLTAVTNYDPVGSGLWVEIFNLSMEQSHITYLGWCNGGTTCSKTTGSPSSRFVATVGTLANYFPPNPMLAVSNSVGLAGPTGAFETAGGSNPAELNQCFACKGDPVNTSTGEFFENDTDLTVHGRGPGLQMARTYSSQRASFPGPLGYGWSFAYDMRITQPTSTSAEVTHENGSISRFTEDAAGVYSASSWVMASLVRNPDLTWTLTRRGREVFDFDTGGHLVRISDLSGNVVSLTRDGADRVTAAKDNAGRAMTFSYEGTRLAAATDPAGRVVSYDYDTNGRLVGVAAPGGAVTQYGYGAANLLTTITDPDGNEVTNSYDNANRVTSQIDRLGGTTTFAYEANGTTTTTSPSGRITKETYVSGQLLTIVKGAGTPESQTWTYVHDPLTYGTIKVTDPLGHSTAATYDTAGNRLTTTDPRGHSSSWTYNALNETTSSTDALGTTTTFEYDSAGNLLAKSTPLAGTTEVAKVTYTHADPTHPSDVTAVTNQDGHTTTYAYDLFGNRTMATDPLGNTVTTSFDAIGRSTATATARGNTITSTYNPAGQLSSVTDALNNTTVFTYDLLGRRTTVTDAQGQTTTTAYDAAGRPTSTTNPGGTTSVNAYDPDGNRTSVTNTSAQTNDYTYDALNRLATATDPLDRTTAYSYDAVGRLSTVTDAADRTTTTTYDLAGNRTGTSYSDGTTPNAAFTYTASNQLATITDGTGTTASSYDSLGRLTAQINGSGQSVTYAYDLAGHLTGLTYPNGQTVTRDYDNAGRLISVTDWLGHTTTFTPDEDGNQVSTTYGNGVTAAATYDAEGRVSTITDTGPGAANLASFTYTRNAIGGLTSTTTTGLSHSTESYTYTDREQLATVNTAQYSYDTAGNIISLASGGSLTYDAANQPTSLTAGGTTTTISADSQGNRLTGPGLNGTTAMYSYDQANRLIGADGTTYTYNANGLRATREPPSGASQQYAWDSRSAVPLMLTDGTTSYLYDDANVPIEEIDSAGVARYYHQDQYGSTRLLTNDEGNADATYRYDPYGNLTAKSGTVDTPLRWNGQYQDPDTGLYYLRARYYDPVTAQFTSADPLAFITQSIYAYAENNPLNAIDPLGLWSWNPFDWTGQEWDTVAAVAGVVGLTAGILGATVMTGGVAAVALGVVATSASAVGVGVGAVGAYNDCQAGFDSNCGSSIAGLALSAVGWKFGNILRGTAWTSRHVAQSSRAQARLAWGSVRFSGPGFDAFNYVRKYC
jgi:RHS repeat-associated protein